MLFFSYYVKYPGAFVDTLISLLKLSRLKVITEEINKIFLGHKLVRFVLVIHLLAKDHVFFVKCAAEVGCHPNVLFCESSMSCGGLNELDLNKNDLSRNKYWEQHHPE